jgi:hypothetical protein
VFSLAAFLLPTVRFNPGMDWQWRWRATRASTAFLSPFQSLELMPAGDDSQSMLTFNRTHSRQFPS